MGHPAVRRYALLGALVALGAPAGLFVLRWMAAGAPPPAAFAAAEIARDPLLWVYLFVATVTAFAGFAAILGVFRERAEALSLTDALTRLWNRRHFETQLEAEVRRAHRYHTPLTLMIIDVDRFKTVNDRYGHMQGDRVLRVIADMIRDSFRSTDVVCRYGGEEIAIIAPSTGFPEALALAERAREHIAQTVVPIEGDPYRITVSVGIASMGVHDLDGPAELMARADSALYRAKADGRNACRGDVPAAEGGLAALH